MTVANKERIRGSSEIPLAPEGREQAIKLAMRNAGQFHKIYSSSLGRTKDTAAALLAANPNAQIHVTDELHPWRLGGDEGKPVDDVISDMHDRVENRPDTPATKGRGPLSTKDGESFNEFKNRSLDAVRAALADHQPGERTALVTHYRNIRAVQAWLNKGAPANNEIDTKTMTQKGDSNPGDMFYMHPGSKTLMKVDRADQPGVYLIRHGATAWNEDTNEPQKGNAS